MGGFIFFILINTRYWKKKFHSLSMYITTYYNSSRINRVYLYYTKHYFFTCVRTDTRDILVEEKTRASVVGVFINTRIPRTGSLTVHRCRQSAVP